MTAFTEPKSLADLLVMEVHRGWSREAVTVTGADLPLGTVLAQVNGKFQQLALTGTGTVKVAAAVLLEDCKAAAADKKALACRRGAVVDINGLIWPAGATDAQKATALAELEARGIVARQGL